MSLYNRNFHSIKKMEGDSLGWVSIVLFLVLVLTMSVRTLAQTTKFASEQHSVLDALPTIKEMIDGGIKDPYKFINMGKRYINDMPSISLEFFEHATKLSPNLAEAYSYMYHIKFGAGLYDEAQSYAQKAVDLNPSVAFSHLDLAQVLLINGEVSAAKNEITQAAKIDPEFVSRMGAKLVTSNNNLAWAMFYFEVVHLVKPGCVLNNINYSYALRKYSASNAAQKVLEHSFFDMHQSEIYFDVAYNLYFKILIDQKKFEDVIQKTSTGVDETFPDQYLYKSLSYYKLDDLAMFEEFALKYFEYSGKNLSSSNLADWANSELKKIRKPEHSKRVKLSSLQG